MDLGDMNGGKNSPFILRCRGALVYLGGKGGIGDWLSESKDSMESGGILPFTYPQKKHKKKQKPSFER